MTLTAMEVEFTRDGHAFKPEQRDAVLQHLAGVTDVLVLSHGWNNDAGEARVLYRDLLKHIDSLLAIRDNPNAPPALQRLRGRTFAAVGVLWPSKRFADEDLIPGGGAVSATVANDRATQRVLERFDEAPTTVAHSAGNRDSAHDNARESARDIAHAIAALDTIETPESQRAYVAALRQTLDTSAQHAEDGSDAFFAMDAVELFKALSDPVIAPGAVAGGGATSVAGHSGASGANSGGAAGLGDMLSGAKAAARRLANFATYYQMKSRAGAVGAKGLAPLLKAIRAARPDIRLHLIGHSFGGRVVTSAAHAMPDNTPALSIALLQAAYSHNGLSADFGNGRAGFFRDVVAKQRASGPVIITHTKNDNAVGVAYPLASRIARQDAAAFGDKDDPYGGMGRNGAQRTTEVNKETRVLGAVGTPYAFQPGSIYNLEANTIRDHGDIARADVAYAILSSAAAL